MLDHSDPESGEKWVSLAGENCQKVILDQLVRLSSSDDVEFSVTYKAVRPICRITLRAAYCASSQ
jgi:hypothetical protein